MTMAPRLRKLVLIVHLVCTIGWIGALAGFLVLAIAGLASAYAETVRAAYVAAALITWYVIVPLAFLSLLTGIVQALATPWGLFRNYWVLFKLVIVAVAAVMLMGKTASIDYVATVAAETGFSGDDLLGARWSIAGHAVGGLAVLLWAASLGLYKPKGVTRYGQRRLRTQPA